MGKIFLGNLSTRQILVMTSAYARPYRLSGWRWGGRTASGDGNLRAIFLVEKSRGSIAFGNTRFSGNNITDEQRDKEKEQYKRRGDKILRNLSDGSIERIGGRRRRKNVKEENCKAEKNRARDKTSISSRCLTYFVKLA